MGIKQAGADLCFKGGLLNGNRYMALFDTGGTELTGNAYARLARILSNWKIEGSGYVNDGEANFPAPQPSAWSAIGSYGMYDASAGGNLLSDFDSADTAAPALGAPVGFLDGVIGFTFSDGITALGGQAMCNAGLLSGTRAVSIHSGDPGTTGANRIGNSITVAASIWDLDTEAAVVNDPPQSGDHPKRRRARNNAIVSWGVQTTDVDIPTHFALRDGTANNAAVLYVDTVTVKDNEDPALGDTIQAETGDLRIYLPID